MSVHIGIVLATRCPKALFFLQTVQSPKEKELINHESVARVMNKSLNLICSIAETFL